MYVNKEREERRTQSERRAATRRALVDAARGLFSELGYHGAAAEEIVARAGLTRGAMYHHFDGKRDLFRAVVLEIQDEIDELVFGEARGSVAQKKDLSGAVMAGYYAYLDACLRPDARRILLLDGPAVLGWEEWHRIDAEHAIVGIEEGLRAFMESGPIERQPVRPLAHLLHGVILEAAMYIAASQDPREAREEIGESLKRLLEGLRRRRKP